VTVPHTTFTRVAPRSAARRVTTVVCETAAMLASASPRKPSVEMFCNSSMLASLLVA
jgi:hypothetical protein